MNIIMKFAKRKMILLVALLFSVLFIIYISDDSNKHYFEPESYGANGDGKSDDTHAIQKAIDKANKSDKVKSVHLRANRSYVITSSLIIKEGVELVLESSTRLQIKGDFRGIELEKNASLIGGVIEVITSNFESEVIYMDGKHKFYGIWDNTEVRGIRILNSSGSMGGTALSLFAEGPSHFISFINFQDISVSGFTTGVQLETVDPKNGEYSWINGNRFLNFSMEECETFFHFDGGESIPNESSGNIVSNLQVQLSSTTKEVLHVNGSDNKFDGVIWDVQTLSSNNPIISFSKESTRNIISFNISQDLISNLGENNIVTTQQKEALN